MKSRLCKPLALILLLAFQGCARIEEEVITPAQTTAVTEASPYPVTAGPLTFNEAPVSAASLSPAVTEIICELGYRDILSGISVYCDYPESVDGLTVIGSAANPDAEAVTKLAPALLISQSPIAKKDISAIELAGTRVLILPAPSSVEELYQTYNSVAVVFGGKFNSDAAEDAIAPIKEAVSDASGLFESFLYVLTSDLDVASNDTFAGDFFSHFGKNAAGEDKSGMTADEISELDPEYIIIPKGVKLPSALAELSAVKEKKYIILDDEILERLERPSSRLSDVVYFVKEKIEAQRSAEADDTEE